MPVPYPQHVVSRELHAGYKPQNAVLKYQHQYSRRCAQTGKQIAILSPSVSNPYHTMMISGIDAAASAAGYQTAIYNTYWNPRTESHLLDTLDFSRVAGIIFAKEGTLNSALFSLPTARATLSGFSSPSCERVPSKRPFTLMPMPR